MAAITQPIASPELRSMPTATTVQFGVPIPHIVRLRMMSPADWEDFVLEWAFGLKEIHGYTEVHRAAGSHDQGRDIIAYKESVSDNEIWHNFQCKHYKDPLTPGNIWIEIGKLCYYTYIHEYTLPERYYFACPCGPGIALQKLLRNPDDIRNELLQQWDDKCKHHITATHDIPLNVSLRQHIQSIDFSIFSVLNPLKLIEEHAATPYHVSRFGGGLPNRRLDTSVPDELDVHETMYIRALFDAYSDRLKKVIKSRECLDSHGEFYGRHFSRSRLSFYCAEELKQYSRDNLPPGCFEVLQNEFFDGVQESYDREHSDGLEKLEATVQSARLLPTTSHPLHGVLRTKDRAGICHQLANDERFSWVTDRKGQT